MREFVLESVKELRSIEYRMDWYRGKIALNKACRIVSGLAGTVGAIATYLAVSTDDYQTMVIKRQDIPDEKLFLVMALGTLVFVVSYFSYRFFDYNIKRLRYKLKRVRQERIDLIESL